MSYEFFIAKRYLKSKHKINFITIISLLSTLGITIGVSALIVVLSVFNGFGSLVTSLLVSVDPHIKVTFLDEKLNDNLTNIEKYFNKNEIINFSPFIEGKLVLINKNYYEPLFIKGIDQSKINSNNGIGSKVISGNYELESDKGISRIILGFPVALRLSARTNDTLYATTFKEIEGSLINLNIPNVKKFVVAGIFETDSKEIDNKVIFTSLKSAQEIFSKKNQFVDGYEIRLNDFYKSESIADEIKQVFDDNQIIIETWFDLHKDLYTVMLIERWSAYIILSLIILVATFNILGSLSMSVIEKKKDIAILRSMGMNLKSLRNIFIFQGMLVGLIGTVSGIIIGLIVCYLQLQYNFYPLDASKYIIDAMPVEVRLIDIIAIGIMAFSLTFLSAIYPANIATKISLIDSIKWE